MNYGYFSRWHPTPHSFPNSFNFSRWRSSQISHPGDRFESLWMSKSQPVCALQSLIPDLLILRQTIDRCIMPFSDKPPLLLHVVEPKAILLFSVGEKVEQENKVEHTIRTYCSLTKASVESLALRRIIDSLGISFHL